MLRINIIRAGRLDRQQHITTLCNHLVSHGYDVSLVNLNEAEESNIVDNLDRRIRLRRINWSPSKSIRGILSRLQAAYYLRAFLNKHECDVIYVIDSWTLSFFWLASIGRFRWKQSHLVYHTFDMLEPGIHWAFYLFLERSICRRADLAVNVDRARARYQQSLYKLKFTPLHIRNALSLSTPLPHRNQELRLQLLGKDPPADAILMACPTIASSERLTIQLINAFAFLPSRYRLFTISQADDYAAGCRELMRAHGLQDRISLLSPMSHSRLVELIACSDIGAIFHNSDSSYGNFMSNPTRLALFVALGIPFIATNVPNLESDVYQFSLGSCCDPNVPEAIASSIIKLVDEYPGLSHRSIHLRRIFETELNYENCVIGLLHKLDSFKRR